MRPLRSLGVALVACLATFLAGAVIASVTRPAAERRSSTTASAHSAARTGTKPQPALTGTAVSLPKLVVSRKRPTVKHETARPAPTAPSALPQAVAPPAAPPPPPPPPSQPSPKSEPLETETAQPQH